MREADPLKTKQFHLFPLLQTPTIMKNNQKILIVILIIVIIIGGYFALKTKQQPAVQQAPITSADTTNWKTYTNIRYGFEFKYPADTNVKIYTGYKMSGYSVCENNADSSGFGCIDFLEVWQEPVTYADYNRIFEPNNLTGIFYFYSLNNQNIFANQILSTFKFTK